MPNLTTGSIVFTKVITHTNKNDEQVQSSISTIKLVDGTITKVFAYAEDISDKDVIFCSKIAGSYSIALSQAPIVSWSSG